MVAIFFRHCGSWIFIDAGKNAFPQMVQLTARRCIMCRGVGVEVRVGWVGVEVRVGWVGWAGQVGLGRFREGN